MKDKIRAAINFINKYKQVPEWVDDIFLGINEDLVREAMVVKDITNTKDLVDLYKKNKNLFKDKDREFYLMFFFRNEYTPYETLVDIINEQNLSIEFLIETLMLPDFKNEVLLEAGEFLETVSKKLIEKNVLETETSFNALLKTDGKSIPFDVIDVFVERYFRRHDDGSGICDKLLQLISDKAYLTIKKFKDTIGESFPNDQQATYLMSSKRISADIKSTLSSYDIDIEKIENVPCGVSGDFVRSIIEGLDLSIKAGDDKHRLETIKLLGHFISKNEIAFPLEEDLIDRYIDMPSVYGYALLQVAYRTHSSTTLQTLINLDKDVTRPIEFTENQFKQFCDIKAVALKNPLCNGIDSHLYFRRILDKLLDKNLEKEHFTLSLILDDYFKNASNYITAVDIKDIFSLPLKKTQCLCARNGLAFNECVKSDNVSAQTLAIVFNRLTDGNPKCFSEGLREKFEKIYNMVEAFGEYGLQYPAETVHKFELNGDWCADLLGALSTKLKFDIDELKTGTITHKKTHKTYTVKNAERLSDALTTLNVHINEILKNRFIEKSNNTIINSKYSQMDVDKIENATISYAHYVFSNVTLVPQSDFEKVNKVVGFVSKYSQLQDTLEEREKEIKKEKAKEEGLSF